MPLVVATMSSKSSSARLADIGGRKLETVGEHVGPPRERAMPIVPLRGRQALIQRDNPLFGRATPRRKPGPSPLDLGLTTPMISAASAGVATGRPCRLA